MIFSENMKKQLAFLAAALIVSSCSAQTGDWSNVESVFGKKGNVQDNVFKITLPRYDLKVRIGDFNVAPGLALTSWIGFAEVNNDKSMTMFKMTMMSGDLVLLDNEVEPVISQLVASKLEVTAIHNHLVGESPGIKYIHFSGKGPAVNLAQAIKSVIDLTGTPVNPPPVQSIEVKPDWSKVENVLGANGKKNGDLLQYTFPRMEKLTDHGMEMPPYMGMATVFNFQMDGNRVAIAGDFVLLADEVNPVLKALAENDISVTAVHNHMLYDNPRLFMMHFWAVGDPEKLAAGLKAALDMTNSKK
jgi:hypothetical protein